MTRLLLGLSEPAGARLDARLEILRALDRYRSAHQLGIDAGRGRFCRAYAAGEIALSAETRQCIGPSLTPRTLRRWAAPLRAGDLGALAGRYARGTRALIDRDDAFETLVVGMLYSYPHCSATHIAQALRARFPDRRLPALRTVQRWVSEFRARNDQLLARVANPDRWRSQYLSAAGSAGEQISALNELWEMDASPTDVLLIDGRHSVSGVIDVASRRLKLHVSRTSKSLSHCALLRRALLDWGVPRAVSTDNGMDYTSRQMVRVFAALGIEHRLCAPFSPQLKPFIERALGTFHHDLVELLPGFIGHSVAERQDLRARRSVAERHGGADAIEVRMGLEQFQKFCDDWTDHHYGHRVHGSLAGRTPFEAAAASTAPIRRIADERALDVLLAPAADGDGLRTITKKGIRVGGGLYNAPELGGCEGQQVRVLLDESDFGAIYVFSAEGEFLCRALDHLRTGASLSEVAAARRSIQRRALGQAKRVMAEAAKEARTLDIVPEILAQRARAAGRVVAFPARALGHSTADLEQAGLAARSRELRQPEISPELAAAQQQVEREMAEGGEIEPIHDGPQARYAHWLRLEARVQQRSLLSAREREFHADYPLGGEYASMKAFCEAFGLVGPAGLAGASEAGGAGA